MNPAHAVLARFVCGEPSGVAAELRAILPPFVVALVDWSTLQREPSFEVDPLQRETESGLLFSARLHSGHPIRFLIVLKNLPPEEDAWMPVRMQRYLLGTLESWRKAHPKSVLLPLTVPVLLYLDPDGAWSAPHNTEGPLEFLN